MPASAIAHMLDRRRPVARFLTRLGAFAALIAVGCGGDDGSALESRTSSVDAGEAGSERHVPSEPSGFKDAGTRSGDLTVDGAQADAGPPLDTTNPLQPADSGSPASVDAEVVHINADYIFPDRSLVDWVSYVEQVAVVTVLEEAEIPPPDEVIQRGEGYIGRKVTLRIDEVIWLNRGATPQRAELELVVFGWILREGARLEAAPTHVPRILSGGRYIVPLLNFEDGLGLITGGSVMALPGDPIATEDIARRGQSEVARALSEETLESIPTVLTMTPRDPLAERYWDLPPMERIQAVRAHEQR